MCYILDVAYYHKYRPQSFQDIIETQPGVARYFVRALTKGQLAHVYLFVGSHGIGKTSVARILARAVNCLRENVIEKDGKNAQVTIPCNECEHCVSIREGGFPDVYELDAASNRGIDEARRLQELIRLSPVLGKKKVYIIDEVHMLTNEAFNALLKTFEEPPEQRLFILCTTELQKVPMTIRSRSTVIEFVKPSEPIIVNYLDKIIESEKIAIDRAAVLKIASCAQGAFRDAAKLLEQVAMGGAEVSEEQVLKLLHVSSSGRVDKFCDCLLQSDLQNCLKLIGELESTQAQPQLFVKDLMVRLRELLHKKVVDQDGGGYYRLTSIVKSLDMCHKVLGEMKGSPLPYLVLEIGVMSLLLPLSEEKQSATSVEVKTSVIKSNVVETGGNERVVSKPPALLPNEEVKVLGSSIVPEETVRMPSADDLLVSDNPPEFSVIKTRWRELVSLVRDSNASVASVLRTSAPIILKGKSLHISTTYRFHKDRLEATKNRQLVESALYELFGVQLKMVCVLSTQTSEKKKDVENVKEVEDDGLVEAALEIFAN